MTNETTSVQMDSNADLLDRANHDFAMTVLPVTIIIGIESVVGIVGNIFIILVYSKQYDRSNFRHFVLFLAVTDLTSCLTSIPAEVFTQLNWYKLTYDWLCKSKAFFNLVTSWTSASILLLFSIDRFRKICFPLKLQIRPSLAFKLCAGIMVSTVFITGPCVLGWGSVTYPQPTDYGFVNVTICGAKREIPDAAYFFLFYLYVFGVLLMMLVITILNLITARKILCGKRMLPSKTGGGVVEFRSSRDSTLDGNTITETISTIDDNGREQGNSYTGDNGNSNTVDNGTNVENAPVNGNGMSNKVEYHNEAYSGDSDSDNDGVESTSTTHQKHNDDMKQKYALKETTSDASVHQERRIKRASVRGKRTQKLVIMFVLTMVFVITTSMYVSITFAITPKLADNSLSSTEKVLYFLGWRMHFINYMVNPFLYGFMDQRFRAGLKHRLCGR